jgi:hypothetical protein
MVILLGSLVCFVVLLGILFSFIFGKAYLVKTKIKRIKKRDLQIRNYLKGFKDEDKLAIIDETPREVFIGERFYLLKPLKYRQYTRLCILFSKMLQKLNEKGIDSGDVTSLIGESMAVLEDDYFRAIGLILYYSNHDQEETEVAAYEGIQKEYDYIRKHASLDQIARVLEVVQMQNDIERALKAFGLLGSSKKKIVQPK